MKNYSLVGYNNSLRSSIMYKKAYLIAFILLFLIIIDITNSLPELTYQETEPNLLALSGDSFTDGTLILRFVKQSQLDNCYEPTLYLRIVKPDGNIKKLDLNDIPQNNFCRTISLTGTPFHKNDHSKSYNNNDDNKYDGENDNNGGNNNNEGNDNDGGKINDSNNGVNNNRRDNNNNNGGGPGVTSGGAAPTPAIPPTNILLDDITVHALSKKYVLLTYYCNIPTSNELCGRIIDFNGETKR